MEPEQKIAVDTLAPNWVYFLSLLAGFVGFLEESKSEDTFKIKCGKFVTRIFSSAFAAMLTFHVIKAIGIPESWYIPLIGIGAHMGTEALKEFGKLWKRKLGLNDDAKKEQE